MANKSLGEIEQVVELLKIMHFKLKEQIKSSRAGLSIYNLDLNNVPFVTRTRESRHLRAL